VRTYADRGLKKISIDFNRDISDSLLWEQGRNDHYREVGEYYPSEMSFPCPRNIELRYLYLDKKVEDPATLKLFEIGNTLEDWFVNRLKKSVEWHILGTQESVTKKINGLTYRGKRDVHVYSYRTGNEYSIEVKSTIPKLYGTKYYTTNWKYYPKAEHLFQHNYYLHENNLIGLLVYIDPFLNIKTFDAPFNQPAFDELTLKTETCHENLTNNTLSKPERTHWGNKICMYCLYKEECKKLEEKK